MSAEKYPEKVAVIHEDQTIRYAELEKDSNRLANLLLSSGVKRGDRVGLYLSRGISSIISIFGVLKAGGCYVPIDVFSPQERLNLIIDRCGIELLISSPEKLPVIENALSACPTLRKALLMDRLDSKKESPYSRHIISWEETKRSMIESEPVVNIVDKDLSYILFTSGSTGVPKGVMITHLNSLTFVNMGHDFFNINKDDVVANVSPLHFDLSVFDIYAAIKAGAVISIAPERISLFPIKLAEFIEKSRITVWNSVPSLLSLMATYGNLDQHDLTSLRLVLFAGEILPLKYLKKLMRYIRSAKFYNVYGQTEANSSTCFLIKKIPQSDSALLPIGKAFPNFEVFALDEEGRLIDQPGQEGELYVRSSSLALGYWMDDENTKKSFVRNPLNSLWPESVYKTGDRVKLDKEGNYVFIGRIDHMIKSRGYRIEIGEIEAVLSSHPKVKKAVVVPIPDDLLGNRIGAYLVPLEESSLKKENILDYCNRRLPKYMLPEYMIVSGNLPLTSSGKVDRKRIADFIKESLGPKRCS